MLKILKEILNGLETNLRESCRKFEKRKHLQHISVKFEEIFRKIEGNMDNY